MTEFSPAPVAMTDDALQNHLDYIVNHVFCPPKLPQEDDSDIAHDHALSTFVMKSALGFQKFIPSGSTLSVLWKSISQMLRHLCETTELSATPADLIEQQIRNMQSGDFLVFLIRAQNAAIIVRKYDHETNFESFEMSPTSTAVMGTKGKLICSYPGPAIAVSCTTANDASFQEELSRFLAHMNVDILDSVATTRKAQSKVREEREATDPRYITELLTGILRGVGKPAEVDRIRKRIGDDVLWNKTKLPWRRSPLWLVIRVALQTTLRQTANGHGVYKSFQAYVMTLVLKGALRQEIASDVLFCMRAKICRRLMKLGSAGLSFIPRLVNEIADKVEKKLQGRWSAVQDAQATTVHWSPQKLDVASDICLSLINSRDYLTNILLNQTPRNSSSSFQPQHFPRSCNITDIMDLGKDRLGEAFRAEPSVALADFERSVEEGLGTWIECVEPKDYKRVCIIITEYMNEYHFLAQAHYADNPEDLSRMILILLELWVGMDRLAVAEHSLLRDYSPEIPANLPDLLLVRKAGSLERLKEMQIYIKNRAQLARHGWSVFTNQINRNTFSVRFYDYSEKHQQLKALIERNADQERKQKIAELRLKNAQYTELAVQLARLNHVFSINRRGRQVHDMFCAKCLVQSQMKALSIEIHEWPLPRDETWAKTVVFELDCPAVFDAWRSATYNFLVDICTPPSDRPDTVMPCAILTSYSALTPYLTSSATQRITLASTAKPFTKSHYKNVPIPSSESDICLPNALQYKLFDSLGSRWAVDSFMNCTHIERFCTSTLPAGLYSTLQYAIEGTTHSSNSIIANQADCHKDLTIHEFIAFGSLRSGPLLQWLNILRELRANTLTFRREEVYTLITQAIWQVGPVSDLGIREWHTELKDIEFGNILLAELQSLVTRVQDNWLEDVSMRIVIALACRLLSSTKDNIILHVYVLLRKVRTITFYWMHQLSRKLQDVLDDKQTEEIQSRVCNLAVTCRATYDVEDVHLKSLLSSPEDDTILIQCAIILHDNSPTNFQGVQSECRRLLGRDWRLSHFLEDVLWRRIKADRNGLDLAIRAVWPGYRPGSLWQCLAHPNDRWLTSVTGQSGQQHSQRVHLNLLDGQLLIDGKPLGRLPKSVTQHSVYAMLFGQKVLDVVPSDMHGMDFVTRGMIYDRQVYFSVRERGEPVVRTKKGEELLEFIPRTKFHGDLPRLLVDGHAHWLNVRTGEVQIRSSNSLWHPTHCGWRIHFLMNGCSLMKNDSSQMMIDIRSPTFQMVSECLKGLEYPENLIIIHEQQSGNPNHSLSVDLPRFGLSFFVNSDYHLECRNIRGMVVDSTQSVGALFGLSNQLVLRPSSEDLCHQSQPRCVIVPYGQVAFDKDGHHVRIKIDTQNQRRVQYHRYNVNTDLGCLVGNVSLTNKLYKVYLHALSSHCLPDPLTGRTGTEEALYELSSASCQSFQAMEPAEVGLLNQIGSLVTTREFYPAHLKRMQKVAWGKISPLAQHHAFYTVTSSIVHHGNRLQLFQEQTQPIPCDIRDDHLLLRAALRNAMFYPEEFAFRPHQSDCEDAEYHARCPSADLEASIFDVASMICRWPQQINVPVDLYGTYQRWQQLSGPQTLMNLRYDKSLFEANLSEIWMSMYDLCRQSSKPVAQYQLLFTLSSVVYGSKETRNLIDILLAFSTIPGFGALHPPLHPSYSLQDGIVPRHEMLLARVTSAAYPIERSPEASLKADDHEDDEALERRRSVTYEEWKSTQATKIVKSLTCQWPCEIPRMPELPTTSHTRFNLTLVMELVKPLFRSCYHNKELKEHTLRVQVILNQIYQPHPVGQQLQHYQWPLGSSVLSRRVGNPPLDQLFSHKAPCQLPMEKLPDLPEPMKGIGAPAATNELQHLLSDFERVATNTFHRHYGKKLSESRQILDKQASDIYPPYIPYSGAVLRSYSEQCNRQFLDNLHAIYRALSPGNSSEHALLTAGQWPRLTVRTLLRKLASNSDTTLTSDWKRVLIGLAESLLAYQRSQRLLTYLTCHKPDEFYKEIQNTGHNYDFLLYSDWLLIQIESHFLVRPIQADIARQMIAPVSGQNTTLQLNMGEGKSSVIVPITAVALADGNNLVRVVVLKSLATQMFQSLVERLAGLTNRRIFYMPFSRSIKLDAQKAQLIQDMYMECRRIGGILVVQPDHMLSYKLMSIDQHLSSRMDIAKKLLDSQLWLESHTRDILDESDEILHVRYQLVYTVGSQQHLEGFPERWTTIQQLLSLVRKHVYFTQQKYPFGIEIQGSPFHIFPRIRILQADAGSSLISMIAHSILNGDLPNFNFSQLSHAGRQAVMTFITTTELSSAQVQKIKSHCIEGGLWKGLLLLRGLLGHGILVYALKERRWRVDYGLDLKRSLLAVPYRAKDVPALRAEFGHPDVAVVLTCLSYYYGGLSEKELDACFELLQKVDNPALEYETWIRGCDVPDTLRQINGLNTRSTEQRNQYLIPLFRQNQLVVDFYLSRVVFPKEAKEFPQKLATSGWDIAERRAHVTTGFSGTNDNRYLLPISITQHDPPHQQSTNAKVLNYLLGKENNHYMCITGRVGEPLSAESFLKILVGLSPEIRVLLDVGAQILELQNRELAFLWLSLKADARAAIFFNESDELTVVDRDNHVELFVSSPFNQQVDQCLLYLDDAHTRGTDVKLPTGFRAAVTLGPKVTKDRLAQGCMRMRKLGNGHSLMFFAPLEVDRGIREAAKKTSSDERIDTLDILRWVMLETCTDIQQRASQWAQQGVDHQVRAAAWSKFSSQDISFEELASAWLQQEAQTLEEMYGLDASHTHAALRIPEIRARCLQLGVLSIRAAGMEEEQEREVVHEIECERQIERPPKATAALHRVHKDVQHFVQTGIIPVGSRAVKPAFATLVGTNIVFQGGLAWTPNFLVTADFATTIQSYTSQKAQDYLRPTQWILSATFQNSLILVIVSPHEVNVLLPEIRRRKKVRLHIYTPRVTRSMKPCDDLQLYCIPPLPATWTVPPALTTQLNLWAGQLYLPNYETYRRLCEFLGIRSKATRSAVTQSDGFIKPADRPIDVRYFSSFHESPVPSLKALIGLRRKGMSFLPTHMGKLLQGRLLDESDFDA